MIAEDLEGIAMAAGATGAAEVAARFLGAAEALRDATGTVIHAVEEPDYNRTLASVRAALGEEAFAAAWAEGRAMPLEAVVTDALEADNPP